jgi:hypothetical protein
MAETISLSELKLEFGTYIGTKQTDILKLLTQPTESEKFMTTIPTTDLEYRAAKAVIDDLVQGFQKAWTPKGTPTFTPIAIPQRRHKVDLAFYPDEVFDSWLGFLADESKSRAEWPITRYIIEQLLIPKVNDNRELKLIGKGDYAAVTPDSAQATGLSMDGFCTILKDLKVAGTSNVNFLTLTGDMTDEGIFDLIEEFASKVNETYQSIEMRVFVSRSWYAKYHRRRRDLHGMDTNYNGSKDIIEGTNMILTPLPSMTGENIIFATPKENFIRVINRNVGASNLQVESVDRQIKVFADWHESVGFGIEEAIFAYIPDESSASD